VCAVSDDRPEGIDDDPTRPIARPTAMMSARVDPAIRKRARLWSIQTGQSLQEIVEKAVTAYLDAEGAPPAG
jgi:predicted HicB family RNase H-like nuclease